MQPDEVPAMPAGDLAFDGCRWRSPERFAFDLTWTPAEPASGAAKLPLQLLLVVGDQGNGVEGMATLDRPGPFTVDVAIRSHQDGRWEASRYFDWVEHAACGVSADAGGSYLGEASPVAAPRPVGAGGLDPDSIEGRAAAIDLLDVDAPLLPLGVMYAAQEPPGLDRLWVHPTASLHHVSVSIDGGCWKVRSGYGPDPDSDETLAEVEQRVGCPPPIHSDDGARVPVDDDVWDVTVWARDADTAGRFAEELSVLWSDVVEPFDPAVVAFDPDSYLDEQLAEFGLVELDRFDWEGGRVGVGISDEGLLGMEVFTAIPGGFNGGGSAGPCREATWWERTDAEGRGFVVVAVTEDRSVTLDYDGEGPAPPVPVELRSSAVADISVGFLPFTSSNPNVSAVAAQVTDADGSPTGCTQWGGPGTTVPDK